MIVANFYHLKNTNGLFYYGVDYLSEDPSKVRRVLVRPAMQKAASLAFPGLEVVSCSFVRLCLEVAGAVARGDFIYAPSSHPLPFISRQMVVVHDVFPFFGTKGKIKEVLLRLSLATSGCRVGYINNSDARAFVRRIGVSNKKELFAPNKFPTPMQPSSRPARQGDRLVVGLFGTDSAKKNYAGLFTALQSREGENKVCFLAYGHRTPYYDDLVQRFPGIALELVESDKYSLSGFLNKVDVIVSVADHEGFGRPIAAALLANVPCLLVQRPVFVEFFRGGARFSVDIPGVADCMLALAASTEPQSVSYSPPAEALDGYRKAVAYLQSQAVMA